MAVDPIAFPTDLETANSWIKEYRSALKQALRQWAMYAEMVEGSDRDFDLKTEKSPEADLYRAALALV